MKYKRYDYYFGDEVRPIGPPYEGKGLIGIIVDRKTIIFKTSTNGKFLGKLYRVDLLEKDRTSGKTVIVHKDLMFREEELERVEETPSEEEREEAYRRGIAE
jgi:hypothetical protein